MDPKMLHKNTDDLIGLKKENLLPPDCGDDKDLADKFVNFFDEKTDNLYRSLMNENFSKVELVVEQVQTKLDRFKELNSEDLKRVISTIDTTYCESDPLPISDIKAKKIFIYYIFS